MTTSVEVIKMVQSILNEKGFRTGPVNGIAGDTTLTALKKVTGLTATWSADRKLVGTLQLYAVERGINPGKVDGLWGPDTQTAYDSLKHQLYLERSKKFGARRN
jgi:hypothetical protein